MKVDNSRQVLRPSGITRVAGLFLLLVIHSFAPASDTQPATTQATSAECSDFGKTAELTITRIDADHPHVSLSDGLVKTLPPNVVRGTPEYTTWVTRKSLDLMVVRMDFRSNVHSTDLIDFALLGSNVEFLPVGDEWWTAVADRVEKHLAKSADAWSNVAKMRLKEGHVKTFAFRCQDGRTGLIRMAAADNLEDLTIRWKTRLSADKHAATTPASRPASRPAVPLDQLSRTSAPATQPAESKGVTVSGRVLDKPGGAGLKDATVMLWHGQRGDLAAARTDKEGRYSFKGVAADDHIQGVCLKQPAGVWCQGQSSSFHVTDQDIAVPDLYARTDQSVSGIACEEKKGQPAAGVGITIHLPGIQDTWIPCDHQGRYTLFALPGEVKVSCFGTQDRYYPPEKDSTRSVKLKAGQSQTVDFPMASAREFVGLVSLPDGKPAKGADIEIAIEWKQPIREAGDLPRMSAAPNDLHVAVSTDDEGRFRGYFRRPAWTDSKPVHYRRVEVRIVATKDGQTLAASKELKADNDEPYLDEIHIDLAPAASVVVRLEDPEGHGIAGAKWIAGRLQNKPPIEGMLDDDAVTTKYLGDGNYRLDRLIPGTPYHFLLSAAGYTTRPVYFNNDSSNITFRPGQELDLGAMRLDPLQPESSSKPAATQTAAAVPTTAPASRPAASAPGEKEIEGYILDLKQGMSVAKTSAAITALAAGGDAIIPRLMEEYDRKPLDSGLRQGIVTVLQIIGSDAARKILLDLALSAEPEAFRGDKAWAAAAWVRATRDISAFRTLIYSADPGVQYVGLEGYRGQPDEKLLKRLKELAKSDVLDVRWMAVRHLAQAGELAPILAAIDDAVSNKPEKPLFTGRGQSGMEMGAQAYAAQGLPTEEISLREYMYYLRDFRGDKRLLADAQKDASPASRQALILARWMRGELIPPKEIDAIILDPKAPGEWRVEAIEWLWSLWSVKDIEAVKEHVGALEKAAALDTLTRKVPGKVAGKWRVWYPVREYAQMLLNKINASTPTSSTAPATASAPTSSATTASVVAAAAVSWGNLFEGPVSPAEVTRRQAAVISVETSLLDAQSKDARLKILVDAATAEPQSDLRRAMLRRASRLESQVHEGFLIDRLKNDPDFFVRREAAGTMGQVGSEAAADALIAAARSDPKTAGAIGDVGSNAGTARYAAMLALAELATRHPKTASRIEQALRDMPLSYDPKDNENLYDTRIQALYQITGDAKLLEPIFQRLKSSDARERVNAVVAFRRIKVRKAPAELVARLKDEDGQVQSWTALVLGEIGDIGTADALVAVASDAKAEPSARGNAVISLGRLRARSAIPAMEALTEISEANIGYHAKKSLELIRLSATAPSTSTGATEPADSR